MPTSKPSTSIVFDTENPAKPKWLCNTINCEELVRCNFQDPCDDCYEYSLVRTTEATTEGIKEMAEDELKAEKEQDEKDDKETAKKKKEEVKKDKGKGKMVEQGERST
jgi:hypothetical protein